MNQAALRAHREVVAYKILETLGIKSFSTKPIFMSYLDSELNTKPEGALKKSEYEAFFIEDKSRFLSENAFSEIKGFNDVFKSFDLANQKTLPEQYQFHSVEDNINYLNRYDLATIELFENIIINGDWFIKMNSLNLRTVGDTKDKNELWNVKIFEKSDKNWVVVPQDFNLSFLCRIENLPEMINLPVDRKIINTLELDKKELLLNTLVSKKADILALTNLIAKDPKHDRIVSFLENRINFIIKELSN